MCYETTAKPPYPPIAGGSATGESLTLKAADGNEFAAFSATADGSDVSGPAIVVLPDVRGLYGFYEDLALRFAEVGINATAFDYFGRTAGVGRRDDDFDFWPEVAKTHPDTVALDVAATVDHLRGNGASSIFTVGFCFGGRHSFTQAARGLGLSGVIGFYGSLTKWNDEDPGAPIDCAPRFSCPVLGLFAGSDAMIPAEDVSSFKKALDDAGVTNEIKTYDGAPHSFFDRSYDQFAAECDDAWKRILGFIDTNKK